MGLKIMKQLVILGGNFEISFWLSKNSGPKSSWFHA